MKCCSSVNRAHCVYVVYIFFGLTAFVLWHFAHTLGIYSAFYKYSFTLHYVSVLRHSSAFC